MQRLLGVITAKSFLLGSGTFLKVPINNSRASLLKFLRQDFIKIPLEIVQDIFLQLAETDKIQIVHIIQGLISERE